MSGFVLHLQSATQYERIEGVESFVGNDASGSFGLLAGHVRMMTCLKFGLARFRLADDAWSYLALPGAVLYFIDNELYINTRRFIHGRDYRRMSATLNEELVAEEKKLEDIIGSLRRMEEGMFKRLQMMQREWGSRL